MPPVTFAFGYETEIDTVDAEKQSENSFANVNL